MAASSLVVSLGLDAVAYIQGWTKVEQQTQKAVEATKAQVAAIDRQIKGFEKQAAMLGMSTREQKLYELALKGATQAQLAQANSALRHVETFGRLQKAASLAGAAIGVSFVALPAILAATFSKIVKGVDDLNDLKDATGSSIENVSALEDVALRTGGSFDTVSTALIKFNKVLKDSEAGKETANILKAIGLNFEELRRLDPAEAMRRTAVAFSTFADDGSKGRAFLQLFGKTTAEIAPLMNDLAKQTELAGKVLTKQAEEAEKFRHRISALGKDVIDLARGLTGPLVEGLNAASAAMRKAGEDGVGFFAKIAAGQRALLKGTFGIDLGGGDENKRLAELNDLISKGNGPRNSLNDLEKERNAILAKRATLLGQDQTELARRRLVKPSLGDITDDPKPPKKAGGSSVSEAQRYLESLQKQLEKTQELTVAQQTAADIEQKRISGITPLLKAKIIAMAEEVTVAQHRDKQLQAEEDQLKRFVEFEKQKTEQLTKSSLASIESLDTLEKSNKELAKEIDFIGMDVQSRAAYENALLQTTINLNEETIARREASGIGEEMNQVLQREVDLLKERQKMNSGKANLELFAEVNKKFDDTAEQANKTLSESIASGLLDGFRKGSSFADIFLNELKAQFAKTVLTPLIQPIVAEGNNFISSLLQGVLGAFGGGSGYGSVSGGWGGSAAGGINNPSAYPGMAGGGPASAGSMHRINERRTEGLKLNGEQFLLMGAQGGNVDSNPRMGGGAPVIYQTLNVGQGVSRNELAAAMVQAKEQAKAEIMRSMRSSNGSFAT